MDEKAVQNCVQKHLQYKFYALKKGRFINDGFAVELKMLWRLRVDSLNLLSTIHMTELVYAFSHQ